MFANEEEVCVCVSRSVDGSVGDVLCGICCDAPVDPTADISCSPVSAEDEEIESDDGTCTADVCVGAVPVPVSFSAMSFVSIGERRGRADGDCEGIRPLSLSRENEFRNELSVMCW